MATQRGRRALALQAGTNIRAPDLARIYSRSQPTLARWRKSGYGPPWWQDESGVYLYPEAEAIAWGKAHGLIRNGDRPS